MLLCFVYCDQNGMEFVQRLMGLIIKKSFNAHIMQLSFAIAFHQKTIFMHPVCFRYIYYVQNTRAGITRRSMHRDSWEHNYCFLDIVITSYKFVCSCREFM